jgi:hypothetical protein
MLAQLNYKTQDPITLELSSSFVMLKRKKNLLLTLPLNQAYKKIKKMSGASDAK